MATWKELAERAAKAAGVDPSIVEAAKKGGQLIEDKKFEGANRVREGQPSELATNLDKFMTEQGIARGRHKGKDGVLSKNDIKLLSEFLEQQAANTPDLKGEFRLVDKDRTIELTDKALKAIKVEVPAKEKTSGISGGVDVAEAGAPNISSNGGPRQLG